MKRVVDHSALSYAGFAAPWSARPGGGVALHLSAGAKLSHVGVVRLDRPEREAMPWAAAATGAAAAPQTFDLGAFLELPAAELAKAGRVTAVRFELFLTRNPGARTILDAGAFRLRLDHGVLGFDAGGRREEAGRLPEAAWLSLSLGEQGNGMALSVRSHDVLAPLSLERGFDIPWGGFHRGFLWGADHEGERPTLNAKFSGLALETAEGSVVWIFPTRLPREPVVPSAAGGLKLHIRNGPAFCMTSPRWDGSSFDPRLVPDHYDAIHCHDDDSGPLPWPATHEAKIPPDAACGIYAFEIEGEGGTERIPFFVTAAEPKAPLLFLVPTATYLAYADEALPPHLYPWKCEDRGHRFAVRNGLKSLYDFHDDGSGVSLKSWRAPKATLRDDYRYPLCGCPHNLPVDLHLLRFLHANGVAFDLVTDHDLHERGLDALKPYSALVSGSHPEYMSVEMEGAIRAFLAEGGSLAYLGGNGFAAAVAFQDDWMELRRSPMEAGRTWDGQLAEQALSITNEPGGFLRARGRGEFSLVGVAISLMGFDAARPFTRTPESFAPDYAWLFAGVESDSFGAEGIVLGGAAGYEVDATDRRLGTSPDTAVLARATGFPEGFFHDPSRWYEGGEDEMRSRRAAEMTLRRLAAGGLIFSAGSVAWCGALPFPGAVNDVGRITLNLLEFLSDPAHREGRRA